MSERDGGIIDWTEYAIEARPILEAAAPHMLASMCVRDSDLILSIVDAAGIEAANQFDALVAVQKLTP